MRGILGRLGCVAIAFSAAGPVSLAQPISQAAAVRGSETPAADIALLRTVLTDIRRGHSGRASALQARLQDPVARKLATWAVLAEKAGSDEVSRPKDLVGWPALAGKVAASPWSQRRQQIAAAILERDFQRAYQLAATATPSSGPDMAEAQFYAGWLALRKLGRPEAADRHFARIAEVSSAPISLARALYWRGRAAERLGRPEAEDFYREAGKHPATFYGQLALERLGRAPISLGADPAVTEADRSALTSRELVQAVDLLLRTDQTQWIGAFAAAAATTLEQPGEYVVLVDRLRSAGRQFDAMRVVRIAAQHGVLLPERGYPVRSFASGTRLNAAFVHALIRQESGFDPSARSPSGARGVMQLLPSTAAIVARSEGLSYSPAKLETAAFNVRLGSSYLRTLLERFDGSYVLAAAGYNAGPNRIPKWIGACGDPRSGRTDPVDFIECIPLSETRNYVMRVMEGMQVYRAKLNGDRALISLETDLSRGAG